MGPSRLAIALGIVLAAFSLATGPPRSGKRVLGNGTEEDLKTLLEGWEQAYQRRDTEWLGRLLDEDFVCTAASGRPSDKRQYIMACVKSPDMSRVSVTEIQDVRVRVYGNVAVVTSQGGSRGQGVSRDPDAQYRYTDVFVRREGNWTAVASQATRVAR
jgi:ketosteroid isomerase-like protein